MTPYFRHILNYVDHLPFNELARNPLHYTFMALETQEKQDLRTSLVV